MKAAEPVAKKTHRVVDVKSAVASKKHVAPKVATARAAVAPQASIHANLVKPVVVPERNEEDIDLEVLEASAGLEETATEEHGEEALEEDVAVSHEDREELPDAGRDGDGDHADDEIEKFVPAISVTPVGSVTTREERNERLKELIRLAESQGYLTFEDLNEAIPDSVV